MSLMNKDARKNIAALILEAKQNKDGSMSEKRTPPREELDNDMGLITAAEDIMRALDSKDAKMLVSGMKAMHEMVAMEDRANDNSSESDSSES